MQERRCREKLDKTKIKERPKKASSQKSNKYQELNILETVREEDEAEEPIYVFDKSDHEGAVVDSCADECVTNKERMPHLRAEETPESRQRETWTCAGGKEIKKRKQITVI